MPINPAIALGVKPVEIANPLAMYSQVAQIQNYQQQNALNQMKMEETQRALATQNALNRGYSEAYDPATGEVNTNRLVGSLASGGYGSQIPGVQKGIREAQAANVKLQTEQQGLIKSKLEGVKPLYQQALSSANPGAAMLEIHSAVHADPVLGTWLKSMGATPERGLQDIMAAITQGPEAVQQKLLSSIVSVDKLLPTLTATETGGGTQMGTRNPLTGAYTPGAVVPKTPLPADVMAQKGQLAAAGAPSITVSTEKKYGEKFAGNVADIDTAKMTAAEKAPDLADSANRIIGLVQQGNLFTGAAADIKLALARALNVVGASNEESIANTEKLIAATGKSTLDAIKGAGLGTGQGFTDKDLRFLQGVAGGTINLTSQTLTELATLQHRVATRSAEVWNKRIKQIPADVLTSMGMPTEPITVPPLAPVKKPTGSRPAGVGADWTMMTDANGNSAWVSPDRKSFVEVK